MEFNIERAQANYESAKSWAGWLEAPVKHCKTLRYYREGRIFSRIMCDGKKYPTYAEYGPQTIGIARGLIEHSLRQAGVAQQDREDYVHNVAKTVWMARELSKFGVQTTRVADALSQWTSAIRCRQVETGEAMGQEGEKKIEDPLPIEPSLRVWFSKYIKPADHHFRQFLMATVNLIFETFELWMCWLDIEDARRFKGETLQEYAIYLAPIHVFEAGDNIAQLVEWGVDKGGVPHGDEIKAAAKKLRWADRKEIKKN
jgi:hypothetical protein